MNTIRKAPVSPALMTHVVAGFPSLSESKEMVRMMNEIGADVIEIQIPFSDPVADGTTMMRCNEISLDRGFRVDDAFQMAKELSAEMSTPLLFMTYYNIVFQRGVERFCRETKEAGVQGVIVPDMPPEEEYTEHFLETCQKEGLCWIPVISPITPPERIALLAKYAGGFWYVVSRTGVTGARDDFSEAADEKIAEIRNVSDLPIALAFGVSTPEHVETIREKADMAVVGSAVQNIFLRDDRPFLKNLSEAEEFLRSLRKKAPSA